MNNSERSHNLPTLRMRHFGYTENAERGQTALSLQDFYLRGAHDDEFKATYAPFLDLEYVEDADLQEVHAR